MTLIGGGIVMLVQPWSIDLYSYSFVTILAFFLVIGAGLIWLGNVRGRSAGERLQPAT